MSVSELLEVRGGPLVEVELWGLLGASALALKSVLASAASGSVADVALCPETLFLHRDGSVQLKVVHKSGLLPPFLPPEYTAPADDDEDSDGAFHATANPAAPDAIEKACIHSLGAILVHCRDYGAGPALPPSSQLLSLLNLLTVSEPSTRPSLHRLSQVPRVVLSPHLTPWETRAIARKRKLWQG